MKAIFFTENAQRLSCVYNDSHIEEIRKLVGDFSSTVFCKEDVLLNPERFSDVEYIFSTWGKEVLTEEELDTCFPKLKCVFHAAGSVQHFGKLYINKGIRVFSAWVANAVAVAEFTSALAILSNKGFYPVKQALEQKKFWDADALFRKFPGNYKTKIGIIGAGMIGKRVIHLLKAYDVETLVYDPYLPDSVTEELGTKKVSLEEIFSECNIVSNHLPDKPETKKMLNYNLFSKMLPYSTFINTGRGAQVVNEDLIRLLTERADVTAFLDVTDPEPLPEDSNLYDLENCVLTPHMAGVSGNEFWRLADYMLEEFKCVLENKPCKYEVTLKMLNTMA